MTLPKEVAVKAEGSRSPLPLKWLTDNGSCYAKETRAFTSSLGFLVCTTPGRALRVTAWRGSVPEDIQAQLFVPKRSSRCRHCYGQVAVMDRGL